MPVGFPRLTNDLLGGGVAWERPALGHDERPCHHNNEYVFEAFYALQLSPAGSCGHDLQKSSAEPGIQPDAGPALVFSSEVHPQVVTDGGLTQAASSARRRCCLKVIPLSP